MKKKDALVVSSPEDYKGDDDTGQLNDIPQEVCLFSLYFLQDSQNDENAAPYPMPTQGKQKSLARPFSSNPKKHPDPLLRSSQRQNAWASSSKHIPKNILHDKEHLYEESLHLKKSMNLLKVENTQLKTKVLQTEKEMAKKDKEIKELLDRLNTPSAGFYNVVREPIPKKTVKTSAHLVMGLKKRISEVQKENKTLKDGLQTLKKSLKMTTTQELESEIKTYAEECTRLRKMLEEVIQEKPYITPEDLAGIEEKIKQQNEVIDKFKEENQELSEKVKKASEEAKKWKAKAEQKKASPRSPETSSQALVREQMREIQRLKDQIEGLKKAARSQQQAEELQKAKAALGKQEREHEQQIRDLEMKLVECKRTKDVEIRTLKEQMEKKEESVEEKKVEIVPILDREDVESAAVELRLNLILANTAAEDLRKILFKNCDDDEKVSIHEIARILKRSPTSLKPDDALKVARYIVEPRTDKEVEYDELLEEQLSTIMEGLLLLIGDYTLDHNSNPGPIQESVLDKLKDKFDYLAEGLQEAADDEGNLTAVKIEEISTSLDLGLSRDELDYILLSMYRKTKDALKLRYNDLLEHLGELVEQMGIAEPPSLPEEEQKVEMKEEPVKEYEEEVLPEIQPLEEVSESKRLEEKSEQEQVEDIESVSEDQMIEIAQKCFSGIAQEMLSQGLTVSSLFKGDVYRKAIEGEEVELISPESFMKGLKKLGLEDLGPLERGCLEKMLAANDSEKGFRVKDLAQILEDYGVLETGRENEEATMRFEDLDKVSMVLLLALTEYLVNAKAPLYNLFGNAIYKQPVQVGDNELEIDIINSPDFFEVLNGIGIETEEKEHENLKAFLCIDPSYSDKFSLDKIKAAIEEFAVNEELRNHARQCYQELVDEEQLQEEPDEGENSHQKEDVLGQNLSRINSQQGGYGGRCVGRRNGGQRKCRRRRQ
eukprot:TRINITY_DN5_c0_g1_i1.p1 TRINITY_DN5_c0_g1~~TRINITY_DN5_c0_g1_i1.p1  ORF type:complete len:942 (-),score=200.59 TRINITY_DN5_c0_g1_i1:2152-4977(-)